jgi:hypothetical protein
MTEIQLESAIGGYFSLECGNGRGLPLLGVATRYQSARAAMAAVLEMAKPKTVWIPHYICTAVTEMLSSKGIKTQGYALCDGFGVPSDLALEATDWLVCVDYFGMSDTACDEAIARYGSERVLVDASQSLFHRPRLGATSVYSARKFVGVPDGGLMVSPHIVPAPTTADESASITRSQHLLTRASGQILKGYGQFQKAEASLSSSESQAMSTLTASMLAAIDFDQVRHRRVANFNSLATALRGHGFNIPTLPHDAVPLCCPVRNVDGKLMRQKLISQNIFSPTYWPDAALPKSDKIGLALRDRTVYLPCDQRYGDREMARITRTLLKIKGST